MEFDGHRNISETDVVKYRRTYPIVYVENEPESFQQFCEAAEVKVKPVKEGEVEKVKEKILKGDVDLLLSFPEIWIIRLQNIRREMRSRRFFHIIIQVKDYSKKHSIQLEGHTGDVQTGTFGQRVGNLEQIEIFKVDRESEASRLKMKIK